MVATSYSKAVLRVAASEVEKSSPQIAYFPSYEIITASSTMGHYFEPDLRSVRQEGVAHVMRVFSSHYLSNGATARPQKMLTEIRAVGNVICDEELLVDPEVRS